MAAIFDPGSRLLFDSGFLSSFDFVSETTGLVSFFGVLRLLLLGLSSSRLSLLGVLLVVLLGLASLGLLGFFFLRSRFFLLGSGAMKSFLLRQVGIGDARHLHGVA